MMGLCGASSKVQPAEDEGGPARVVFVEDAATPKKSGVRRPVYAPFLSQPGEATPPPSKVHLFVNPSFSGVLKIMTSPARWTGKRFIPARQVLRP